MGKMRNNAREDFNKLSFMERIGLKDEKVKHEFKIFGIWLSVLLAIVIWYGVAGVFEFDCEEFSSDCVNSEGCFKCDKSNEKIMLFFIFAAKKLFGLRNFEIFAVVSFV